MHAIHNTLLWVASPIQLGRCGTAQ